jgi:hypothetical protein
MNSMGIIVSDRVTRLGGLRRFAIAITLLNLLGHTVLGFEQSWAQPLIALGTAYSVELLLELVDARVNQRSLQFVGGVQKFVDFLLPAHITALAIASTPTSACFRLPLLQRSPLAQKPCSRHRLARAFGIFSILQILGLR